MKSLPKAARGPALACAALAMAFWLLLASTALAAGSLSLRSNRVSEVSGGWHIYCTLAMPRAPLTPHVTLKFLFTKTAVYERDLVDNSPKPVMNRQPLVNQNPSVESLEVDFSDASGKIYPVTHFDFSITRIRGYEAGEYKLQVRTSDGIDIGSPVTLTLNGDNPVVDRRAMNFEASSKGGIKKVDNGVDAGPKKEEEVAAVVNTEVVPAGSAPPFLSADAFQKQPEEVADHPKGCGCDVPGLRGRGASGGMQGLSALGVVFGLTLVAARRRRARTSRGA